MKRLFTSEAVSEGHPDKLADQISDAILDAFLEQDKNAHVACETLVTSGLVVLAGEIKSTAQVDVDAVARRVIRKVGYVKPEYGFDDSCGIINTMHKQSVDIDRGVSKEDETKQGAGDQGIMFGYATNETKTFLPLAYSLANNIVKRLSYERKKGSEMDYLRPDSKSQVTVEYGKDGKPCHVDTILVSTQHDEFDTERAMLAQIAFDIKNFILPDAVQTVGCENIVDSKTKLLINPTGKFVIGGPHGDTGLTGRKIIVDTYGGYSPHGGGAFSGKDPSKVDRSAAYAARFIAKNLVANGVADEITVQLGYAIGIAEPVSICVNGKGFSDGWNEEKAEEFIRDRFSLTPHNIINGLSLKSPIYEKTASYGHFGRASYIVDGKLLFPWEKLDNLKNIHL